VEPIVVAMGMATGLCVALLVYAVWQCFSQIDSAPEHESGVSEIEARRD